MEKKAKEQNLGGICEASGIWETSESHLRGILEASGKHLGGIWETFGRHLGKFGRHLGGIWADLAHKRGGQEDIYKRAICH